MISSASWQKLKDISAGKKVVELQQGSGKSANKAEDLNIKTYDELLQDFHVVPGTHGKKLIQEIGKFYLFQRLGVN